MESADIYAAGSDALSVMLIISAPAMIVALVVGLIVSLFQALTQIQEATLTFVPKLLAVFLTLSLSMGFMVANLTDLNNRLHDRIVHIK